MYIDYNFLLKELPEEYRDLSDVIDYNYFIELASIKVDSLLKGEYYDYEQGKKVKFEKEDPPFIIKSLTQVLTAKYITDFFLRGTRISAGGAIRLYGLEVRYNGDQSNMQAYRDLFTERFKDLLQIALNTKNLYLYSTDYELSDSELGRYLNYDVRYNKQQDGWFQP